MIGALLAVSAELTSAMSDATHYIVATAGHVDHGKSALIKALTGTDPDRLPEEKARGITIDLGFAHLELPSPTSPCVIPRRHRRRARTRRLREEHGGRRRLHRPRAAGRRGRRWVDAADGGASPDPDLLRRASSGGGAHESRPGRGRGGRGVRRPSAAAGQRLCRRADRADLGRHRTRPRHAEVTLARVLSERRRRATSASRGWRSIACSRCRAPAPWSPARFPGARCSAASRSSFNRAGTPRASAGSSRTAATSRRAGPAPAPR